MGVGWWVRWWEGVVKGRVGGLCVVGGRRKSKAHLQLVTPKTARLGRVESNGGGLGDLSEVGARSERHAGDRWRAARGRRGERT